MFSMEAQSISAVICICNWPGRRTVASCSPGKDEHELQAHRCGHHFRRIGKFFCQSLRLSSYASGENPLTTPRLPGLYLLPSLVSEAMCNAALGELPGRALVEGSAREFLASHPILRHGYHIILFSIFGGIFTFVKDYVIFSIDL